MTQRVKKEHTLHALDDLDLSPASRIYSGSRRREKKSGQMIHKIPWKDPGMQRNEIRESKIRYKVLLFLVNRPFSSSNIRARSYRHETDTPDTAEGKRKQTDTETNIPHYYNTEKQDTTSPRQARNTETYGGSEGLLQSDTIGGRLSCRSDDRLHQGS